MIFNGQLLYSKESTYQCPTMEGNRRIQPFLNPFSGELLLLYGCDIHGCIHTLSYTPDDVMEKSTAWLGNHQNRKDPFQKGRFKGQGSMYAG